VVALQNVTLLPDRNSLGLLRGEPHKSDVDRFDPDVAEDKLIAEGLPHSHVEDLVSGCERRQLAVGRSEVSEVLIRKRRGDRGRRGWRNLLALLTGRGPALDLDAEISCEWRPGDVW